MRVNKERMLKKSKPIVKLVAKEGTWVYKIKNMFPSTSLHARTQYFRNSDSSDLQV